MESEDCDETISISHNSTADCIDQYGVTDNLNMIAYHYQQLSEIDSQLVKAIPKLAPWVIAKALAQLPPASPQVPMTSVA